jgi:hypothetical protein
MRPGSCLVQGLVKSGTPGERGQQETGWLVPGCSISFLAGPKTRYRDRPTRSARAISHG